MDIIRQLNLDKKSNKLKKEKHDEIILLGFMIILYSILTLFTFLKGYNTVTLMIGILLFPFLIGQCLYINRISDRIEFFKKQVNQSYKNEQKMKKLLGVSDEV